MKHILNKYKEIKNLRDWAVIIYISYNPKCTRKQISKDFNLSPENIAKVIKSLKQKNIIKVNGATSNAYYELL